MKQPLLSYEVDGWKDRFPYGIFILLAVFYTIGIIIYKEGSLPTIDTGKYLIHREILDDWALKSQLRFQATLFTYHFIHFGLIHWAYTGGLLFYFVQGLERATSTRFILVSYFLIASLFPIFLGFFALLIISIFPPAGSYLLVANTFLGSSIGIWGLIGLSAPVSYRRRFYWFNLVGLLIPEFVLKLVAGRHDLLTNVSHILVFVIFASLSYLFIEFKNNTGQVGGIELNNRKDWWLVLLLIPHVMILIVYFLQIMGYLPTQL